MKSCVPAFTITGLCSVLLAQVPATKPAAEDTVKLVVVEPPILTVDPTANTGTAQLDLRNASNRDVAISLSASDFISKTTGKRLGARVTFSEPAATAGAPRYVHPQPLKPGQSLALKVEVAQVWEAGESEAKLLNAGVTIGKLTARKDRFPFAVKLDAAPPDQPAVHWQSGAKYLLPLKNDDAMTYPVAWKLVIGSREFSGWKLLPPSGATSVEVAGGAGLFANSFASLFKDQAVEGRLFLTYQPEAGQEDPAAPAKHLPLTLYLKHPPSAARTILRYALIFIVLCIGGVASMFLHHGLPNFWRRLRLKERLDVVGKQIADLSFLVDSRLRVAVGVERKRLKGLLQSQWAFSPDFASVVKDCGEATSTLEARVNLLEQIDSNLEGFAALRAQGLPPTLVAQIESEFAKARELLVKAKPAASDLQSAQALITAATARVNNLNQADEALVKELTERVANLNSYFQNLAANSEPYAAIRNRLPGPFATVEAAAGKTTFGPQDYFQLDTDSSKLRLIMKYLQIHRGSTDPVFRQRLEAALEPLLGYLIPQSWEALASARLLVREMSEDVFREDLKRTLESPESQLSIVRDRSMIRANEPVEWWVSFRRKALNSSAAREEYTCVWDFEHDGPRRRASTEPEPAPPSLPVHYKEKGWTVAHYFPSAHHYQVSASFEDWEGRPVALPPETGSVSVTVQPSGFLRFGERFRLELIRLAVAIVVAEGALVAGAEEKLLKLDLVSGLFAVFLLGFGADWLKNLLTQRQD